MMHSYIALELPYPYDEFLVYHVQFSYLVCHSITAYCSFTLILCYEWLN